MNFCRDSVAICRASCLCSRNGEKVGDVDGSYGVGPVGELYECLKAVEESGSDVASIVVASGVTESR